MVPAAAAAGNPLHPYRTKDGAWLKYLAIFVVVGHLLEFFASFVAYNQPVDTTMAVNRDAATKARGRQGHEPLRIGGVAFIPH